MEDTSCPWVRSPQSQMSLAHFSSWTMRMARRARAPGRGTADHLHVNDQVDVLCGSLSKSLGSTAVSWQPHARSSTFFASTQADIFSAPSVRARRGAHGGARRHPARTATPRASVAECAPLSRHAQGLGSTLGQRDACLPIVLGSKNLSTVLAGIAREGCVHRHVDRARRSPGKDLVRTASPLCTAMTIWTGSPTPWLTRQEALVRRTRHDSERRQPAGSPRARVHRP